MVTGNEILWTLSAIVVTYFLAITIVSSLRARQFARSHGCQKLKNAPQKDPIFGVDVFLDGEKAMREKRFLPYLAKHFEEHGSTFKWNLMGDDLIFTNEPKNLQAILATKFSDFELGKTRQQVTKPFWGIGIFNTDGPMWVHSRALVRPNFSRDLVSDTSTYNTHVSNLINQLPSDGSTFDIQDYFFSLTLDTATEHLFGKSTNCLRSDTSDDVKRFVDAFAYAQRTVVRRIRMGKLAFLDRDPKFSEACACAHRYVEPLIRGAILRRQLSLEATESKKSAHETQLAKERYCFLDEVVKEVSDPEQIQGQVMNILVAGRDTTACLLSSLFFTLSRRSDVMARLREEIAELSGRDPTYEDIKGMRYLNWAIKETLRLYTVVPMNTRVANKDTYLPSGGGFDGRSPVYVRKGQMIVYQAYSLHRRTDLWGSDANDFRPERWQDARPSFEYLPFNAGPRICPGEYSVWRLPCLRCLSQCFYLSLSQDGS
ncbi:MAG: hypothetical protein L6R38_002702 [Xanthoria sp. 2 TBL-2021]|nr:MAG: hypothetical protein L6R38_002702 [Xanthoria sp. 2 TBL-2021]